MMKPSAALIVMIQWVGGHSDPLNLFRYKVVVRITLNEGKDD